MIYNDVRALQEKKIAKRHYNLQFKMREIPFHVYVSNIQNLIMLVPIEYQSIGHIVN